jgi:CheY-like chemotaxis protein
VELGQELLESLGYVVSVASNSYDALALFRSAPSAFDLVITDLTMPGMTGEEMAREMMASRADIPVILCTGFSDDVTEQKALEIGVREVVMKPYSVKSLDAVIRKVLAGSEKTN